MPRYRRRTKKKRSRSRKISIARRRQRGGNIIKKIIYCFWTGTNAMSPSRKECLDKLIATSGCKVQLIDPTNLQMFLLPNVPLHDSYQYLSETHKSDYLRTCFMHFLGGGYSDIKNTTADWNKAFDDLNADPKMLLNGYHEPSPNGVAGDESVKKHWNELLGDYIISRADNCTAIILIDSKVGVQKNDLEFFNFLYDSNLDTIVLLTKIDRLSNNQLFKNTAIIKKQLTGIVDVDKIIPISSKTNRNMEKLYNMIKEKMEEKC